MTAINQYCPRSGKPVSADALASYRGVTVGFCNPHCRDDFAAHSAERPEDTRYFDALIQERHLASGSLSPVDSTARFSRSTALLLIDIQKAFDHHRWGQRNNPQAEENAARLLASWRASGRPIVHVRHLSPTPGSLFHADSATSAIKDLVQPREGEPVFTKAVNSAFIGTGLEVWLREQGCETIVITGLTTQHCVSTTARMAGNLGFEVYFVADATAAFALTGADGQMYAAEEIHHVSLATLHDEFAMIIDTESVLRMAALNHASVVPQRVNQGESEA